MRNRSSSCRVSLLAWGRRRQRYRRASRRCAGVPNSGGGGDNPVISGILSIGNIQIRGVYKIIHVYVYMHVHAHVVAMGMGKHAFGVAPVVWLWAGHTKPRSHSGHLAW